MKFCGAEDIHKLRREKQKAVAKNDLKEVARLCNVVGEALSRNGDYEDAIAEHQMEFDLSESIGDPLGSAIASRKIGECYCELGQFEKAVTHQRHHLVYAQREGSAVEEQRAYATLGRTYLCQSDAGTGRTAVRQALHRAQEAFVKSLEVCKRLADKVEHKEYQQMKARLILNLGLVYEGKGDVASCKQYLQKGVDITKKESLTEDLHRCLYSLGMVCLRNGENTDAYGHLQEALKSARKLQDKLLERETLTSQALVCVNLEDYPAAKRCLKRAHKHCQGSSEELQKIIQTLKTVLKMETLTNELHSASSSDQDGRKGLCEQLGDRAASLTCYKLAIQYYKKMLAAAMECNPDSDTDKALVPIYVSLSQTYLDDKDYRKAELYFRKELRCYTEEHSEICRTLINIAEAQDQSDQGYSGVKASFLAALKHARLAKDKKLQAWVLHSLSVVQEAANDQDGKKTTDEMLQKIVKKYKINLDEEDVLEAERDSQLFDDSDNSEVDLDLITDSEDSEAEEEFGRRSAAAPAPALGRCVRRTNTRKFKLNEKGETPLHRACIDGRLKQVKLLLDKGHPVNPRDYAGWLPLHEAANHGHADIVEHLLDHGASIDDRGGDQCGGVTPLIDACGCGNGAVAEVLVRKGANVLAKDEDGNNPLRSLLSYRKKSRGSLTREEVAELDKTELLLRKAMRSNSCTSTKV